VSIGFFPDVGATWLLSRMPGETGTYCALTGNRLRPEDAVATGVATHRIRSDRFGDLTEALYGTVPVDAVLAAFAEPAGEGPLAALYGVIDRLFSAGRAEDILAALDAEAASASAHADWARACAATIRTKSPLSLKIALAQMRWARDRSFEDCMRTEFRIVSRIVYGHELYEGVRAVIVDKDNAPRWSPADLAGVSPAEVERHFAPLADVELQLA
jgi:enoyl-CoA hydratase